MPTKVCRVKAMVFPLVMCGCESWTIRKGEHWRIAGFKLWCWRRLLISLGLQGDPTSQSKRKWIMNIQWKDWCWSWSSNILATWCEELTHWKRPWCWKDWRQEEEEGDNRGWDGWMALPSQWTWVWASSGSWWWTGKPGLLQSMGSQRVRHDWATKLNWTTYQFSQNRKLEIISPTPPLWQKVKRN